MRSRFNLATESADSTDGLSAGAPPIAENHAGLLEAALEDHGDMLSTEKAVDELVDGQDKLTEIVEVAQESLDGQGLSPRAMSILKMAVKNIVGKNIAARAVPSMESYEISHPKQITAIALEGVADTIKQFWQAIKNQMGKFWNQTKAWYLKTFDVANKIIARSKALDEKANNLTTTPTEKSFELSGANLISINYQVKDPVPLLAGLNNMKVVLDSTLDNVTKENGNDQSDRVLNACKNLLARLRSRDVKQQAGQTLSPQDTQGLIDAFGVNAGHMNAVDKITTQEVTGDQELVKKLGTGPQQKVFASAELPGSRKLYRIDFNDPALEKPETATIQAITDFIKGHRVVLSDASAKPREMEGAADVKTLNASQISQIASTTGEMGENILKYKKEFEARDRFISKLVKGFDQIVKELDGTPVEHPQAPAAPVSQQQQTTTPAPAVNGGGNGQAATTTQADGQEGDAQNAQKPIDSVDKDIRKLANGTMQHFKKNISISGSVLTHAIKVANVFLTYGERSLAQYGG